MSGRSAWSVGPLLVLLMAAVDWCASPVAAMEPERPDLIVILADDLGWGDLSCYGGEVPTPALDRMAAEGLRFTQGYVTAPICSPSRCGLLTGQHPARWRITSYLQTRAGNLACGQADFLDPAAPSLPRVVRGLGYATAHIGKWHLGGGRDVQDAPKFAAYGYDLGLGTYESPEPHPDITATKWIWSPKDPVKRWERNRWMVDHSIGFLSGRKDQPCFINLWLDDPHTPWVPGPEAQKTADDTGPERLRGVLTDLDHQIGRLLDHLRTRGRPALVLFIGDNGPAPTFDGRRAGGLRGAKLSVYEGGIRVPFIAWGPGLIPAGRTDRSSVVSTLDLMPTLAHLAGGSAPAGGDGVDIGAVLRGQPHARSGTLYFEYGRNPTSFKYPRGRDRSPALALRRGQWKLLADPTGERVELYDLDADPREEHDLATDRPDVAGPLTEDLRRWWQSLPR